jgi:hypothetical protein
LRVFSIVILVAGFWAAGLARAELKATTLDKPIPVQAVLEAKPGEKISGQLVRYDETSLVIKTAAGERTIQWPELTATHRYLLHSQLIDRKNAEDWLDVAELAMKANMREQAKMAVGRAATIDGKTRVRGDAILRGQGNAKPEATTTAVAGGASTKPAKDGSVAAAMKPNEQVVHYQKSTPEQDAAAIKLAQDVAGAVAKQFKLNFAELQTAHFIIFTDWDPREHDFLTSNLEKAYSLVSKEFNIPDKENVFVGKLPVLMFAKQSDFGRYSAVVEKFPVSAQVAGYYTGHGDGSGHLVMWKPDVNRYGGNVRMAEERWAYTLTHEFTHAFVARYRTNRKVPRWMNEGLAEVIASRAFPNPGAYARARSIAEAPFDFQKLFDDKNMPGGEMYPVMRTMVEALLQENYKAFLAMFNDIKDGMDPEEALRKHYKAGYGEFEQAWRAYAKRLRD